MLFFAKNFRRMVRSQEAGVWDQFDIEEIAGKTLGIVGAAISGVPLRYARRPWGWRCWRCARRKQRWVS